MKRENFLNWEQFFMTVAKVCAMRSKDPSTQVGAILVNNLNQIISTGYNGFPRGVNDDEFPWTREGEWIDTKYPYVAHAELNAIVSARTNLTDSDVYVTLFPCNECTKIIIQAGIKKVYYLEDKYKDSNEVKASKRMLDAAKIEYKQINDFNVKISID
ncbi:deoxycytidylate deaminase [Mesoplasma florum L1]|uniref:Deoxycytidylate deaminase n=2 Tax=Mesoplasma florum TaxID=2151 RepID=Q6F179_MESFL|nr:dCMP deaminase family protein [Mesoplasma florum]AAT75744.1 deoxycytidylate deaminase [Mesoplasma florum L1]AGY41474.1 dCMP deaminase; Late competence protein ComEB [Mesoplasma florum W37]ATI73347.1 cytidine deaminase [Mesoplasma florum]ATI74026.1 cytidine deaminase [Mesoplasma florum]AVN59691.1 cytidine deaminase [Mesoplasma florum]